jgi:hypothetical protein
MMCDAKFLEKWVQLLILTTPIGLHSDNISRKFAFNKVHEIVEDIKDIRFFLNKINPCELAKIIDEAYIIIVSTYRGRRRTPNIREDLL